MTDRYKIHLGIICIFIIFGILLVGIWPLDFFSHNDVDWLPDTNGIRFYKRGIVYSSDIFNQRKQSHIGNNEITIEIWLLPRKQPERHLARIFALVDCGRTEYFTLAHWNRHLYVVRDQITAPNLPDPNKRIVVRKALPLGKEQFITVSSDGKGTAIYTEGNLKKFDSNFTFMNENIQMPTRLILGDSPRGNDPWNGDVLGLAIYRRSMNKEEILQNYHSWLHYGIPAASQKESLIALYLFDEREGSQVKNNAAGQNNLIIPKRYQIVQKVILKPPGKISRRKLFFKDTIVNVLGFIPVGFFILAYLSSATHRARHIILFLTIVLCVGLSLSIELLQVYLPSRFSSASDLICNSLGAAAGTILFLILSTLRNIF